MKIFEHDLFKIAQPDEGKILFMEQKNQPILSKLVYLPKSKTNAEIEAMFSEIDENNFLVNVIQVEPKND